VESSNKSLQAKFPIAVIAYVPVVGTLYIFLFEKDNALAFFHAKQAFLLTATAILTPILWIMVGWLLTVFPLVGALLAAASFTLVMLVYIFLFVLWIVGISYALQNKLQSLPIIGLKHHLPVDNAES
jgi:uncharacterized membrane protein